MGTVRKKWENGENGDSQKKVRDSQKKVLKLVPVSNQQ
jgi:uncharacterized protein YeeX (DUF496 family)